MKITILYESKSGGETRATENIIKQLKQNKILYNTYSSKPLTDTSSWGYFYWIIENIFYYLKIVRKTDNCSIIYTTTYTAGLASVVFKLFYNYKIIFHYHGSRIPKNISLKKHGFHALTQFSKFILVYFLHAIVFLGTNLIIVPSLFSKKHFSNYFPFIKNRKIVVIPNGVDFNKFQVVGTYEKNELRKKFQLNRDERVVLYVGRINAMKGIKKLLAALIVLRKEKFKIKLILAVAPSQLPKDIDYKRSLDVFIQNNNLDNTIYWVLNYKKIEELYAISDLVILPSEMENFPLVMLEAFACKTLFIGSRIAPISKFLNQIDSRLVINKLTSEEIAQKILFVLRLKKIEKNRIIEKAYQLTHKYTWKNTVNNLLQFVKSI